MYVYESHLGGIYASEEPINFDELYCETCGDYDWEIGNFDSAVELLKYMADNIDANDGHGGYCLDMLLEDLHCFDDVPEFDKAAKIVKENRGECED
jgi:hypothetical protein